MKKIITISFTYNDPKHLDNSVIEMLHILYRGIVTTFNWFIASSFKVRDEE